MQHYLYSPVDQWHSWKDFLSWKGINFFDLKIWEFGTKNDHIFFTNHSLKTWLIVSPRRPLPAPPPLPQSQSLGVRFWTGSPTFFFKINLKDPPRQKKRFFVCQKRTFQSHLTDLVNNVVHISYFFKNQNLLDSRATESLSYPELKTGEGYSADIYPWRYTYVRTMSAQCWHNVRTMSALYPSSVFSSKVKDRLAQPENRLARSENRVAL